MPTPITREHLDKHVHSRVRTRVRIYLGISVLIILAIAYRIWAHGGGLLYPLAAALVGILAGIVFSRMYVVSWDKDAEKVVSRMDMYGAAILVVYIIFELSGEHLIEGWFSGAEVWTMILSLAGGAVLGRGLALARNMLHTLRAHI